MGRAEKYADVVQKYEEEQEALKAKQEVTETLEEDIDEEVEEKLSMTRELKFQEMQKKLDDTVTVGDAEEIVKLEEEDFDKDITSEIEIEQNALANTDTLEVETLDEDEEVEEIVEPPKKEKKAPQLVSSKEIKKVKNEIEDDLYLTTSLKPFHKRFKLRKVFKVLFSIILFIVIILLIFFFGFKPLYNHLVNAKPRMVFDNTIDYVIDATKKEIEAFKFDNNIVYSDFNFNIDSNVERLGSLNSYSLGYRYGVDYANKKYQEDMYIKYNGEPYGVEYLENDNKAYLHMNPADNYVSLGNIDKLTAEDKYYSNTSDIMKKGSSFLNQKALFVFLDKEGMIIKSLFEDSMFSKTSDEMDVNGESVKVTRNTLKLNAVEYRKVIKKFIEANLNDSDLMREIASLTNSTPEEVKKELTSRLDIDVKDNYELVFNIYTNIGNKVLGFDISENGFRIAYLYQKDNNYNLHLNVTKNKDCKDEKKCENNEQRIIDVKGENKDNYTLIKIQYNGRDLATLNARSLKEKIDFDYELYVGKETYRGTVVTTIKNENQTGPIDVSIKMKDDKYIIIKGEYSTRVINNFGNINSENVINESRAEAEIDNYINKLSDKEIGEALLKWYDIFRNPEQVFK